MAVRAVRGAIRIEGNTEEFIDKGVKKLISALIEKNKIDVKNIISIIFSQTDDLTIKNPATALRRDGFSETPLLCTKEPNIIGAMKLVIRVLITTELDGIPVPVYLGGAKNLRPDLKN